MSRPAEPAPEADFAGSRARRFGQKLPKTANESIKRHHLPRHNYLLKKYHFVQIKLSLPKPAARRFCEPQVGGNPVVEKLRKNLTACLPIIQPQTLNFDSGPPYLPMRAKTISQTALVFASRQAETQSCRLWRTCGSGHTRSLPTYIQKRSGRFLPRTPTCNLEPVSFNSYIVIRKSYSKTCQGSSPYRTVCPFR